MIGVAARQVPEPGAVTLDHLAHWVPDIDAASARLEQLGFTLTPYSRQFLPPAPGAEPAPAGTGNRCIMLEDGYVEVLGVEKDADTPNAATLRQGMQRYVGVHIVAFGAADSDAVAARLTGAHFGPLPVVHLQRRIGTEAGEGLARFSVLRLGPGAMPEGRIQYCIHHTPELLWQQRWLAHPNGALGLVSVMICVADTAEATSRFARFLGRVPERRPNDVALYRLDRGFVMLGGPKGLMVGTPPSGLPYIAAYGVRVRALDATARFLEKAGVAIDRSHEAVVAVEGGPGVGGTILFHA